MRKHLLLSATGLGLLLAGTAMAETTVNWLHIEQNPAMVGYWEEIARSFEADIRVSPSR
jgi:raffinose/stachyose/melibiose transport system substrate-binding protein